MAVSLTYHHFGEHHRPAIIILHGLLGSSRNWMSIAKTLAHHFSVYTLDLRNHGRSPHNKEMTFDVMKEDVLTWLDEQHLSAVTLLGHSMGGKVAMMMACHHPERVKQLVIVDIVPKAYQSSFLTEMEAMLKMDLDALKSRKQADVLLSEVVDDWALRQFFLTNLQRRSDGQFSWQVNLPVLIESLKEIRANPLSSQDVWLGKTLFIKGGQSAFIQEKDEYLLQHHFPNSDLVTLAQSGHNPHIDTKDAFIEILLQFLHLNIEA